MWRRLVARTHPDAGGDQDLFIWTMATRDVVCGGELGPEIPRRQTSPRRDNSAAGFARDRIPFEEAFDKAATFSELTHQVIDLSGSGATPEIYAQLLGLLADCHEASEADDPVLFRQQHQGATYKQLAAIAHRVGMSKAERVQWYRVCESIPLSQRHAGHILGKLQKAAA
jgi:hypothetical protein